MHGNDPLSGVRKQVRLLVTVHTHALLLGQNIPPVSLIRKIQSNLYFQYSWRHHTNPVGKEWKWAHDNPEFIVEQAVTKHKEMVKQMKGVPGVKPERYQEACQSIRHCALSLVGEPIMYPEINRYLELLHERNISTFLVTNAQFPERIETLTPITQLYISVDAPTKDDLKAVDRPLFSDFWERFIQSMKAISDKQQRTVYRMTLVKDMNMGQIEEYAKLIDLGRPTLIEIKGVTFCGDLNASSMTMQNVPFHQEVWFWHLARDDALIRICITCSVTKQIMMIDLV